MEEMLLFPLAIDAKVVREASSSVLHSARCFAAA